MASFPIIALGTDYWEHLRTFIRQTMVEEATISPDDIDLVTLTDSPQEAIELIRAG
jgi:predicted Rossmann-fold nucleotide-binding protein